MLMFVFGPYTTTSPAASQAHSKFTLQGESTP